MSEIEPSLNLDIDRLGKYELTRHNSGLFTFIGQTALNGVVYDNQQLDHIYMRLPEDHESKGVYFFKTMTPKYQQMAAYMLRNKYPLALNFLS